AGFPERRGAGDRRRLQPHAGARPRLPRRRAMGGGQTRGQERSVTMSRRARKPRPKQGAPKRFAPKPGPFDVYVREFVSARTGREERYRNIGEHPLTLAHARSKVSDEQFAAGEEIRRLYKLRALSGQDSTL